MTQSKPMIEVTNLDKYYGKFQALKNVSLTVDQGVLFLEEFQLASDAYGAWVRANSRPEA